MAEVASQPAALGSTVFGYNDAYRRLRPFVLEWRAACAAAGNGGGAPLQHPNSPLTTHEDINNFLCNMYALNITLSPMPYALGQRSAPV